MYIKYYNVIIQFLYSSVFSECTMSQNRNSLFLCAMILK